MRMMMKATIPCEAGNAAVRNGTLGTSVEKVLADMKPEAVYFAADGGDRTAFVIFDMQDSSELPKLAEPFFLTFNAKCTFQPVMTPEDLAKAGPAMAAAAKKYGS